MMRAILINSEHTDYGVASIPLPIPDEEYADCIELLRGLEIGGVTSRDCYVDQIMDAPPVLDMLEGVLINIDELDFLARSIDRFTREELAQFQCAVSAENANDMTTLINLSFCCVDATVITDFSDLEHIGKEHYMATHGGVPAGTYDQLNGEGIARGLIASGEGKVTPYGVFFRNNMCLEPLYTGGSFPAYADRPYLMEVEIKTSGEDTSATIFLPQPEKRLKRLLERAEVEPEQTKILTWYSDLPDALTKRLAVPQEDLQEVNRLCVAVGKLQEAERIKLAAVVEYVRPEDCFTVRRLTEILDAFELVPNIKTPEEYGRWMIEHSGHYIFDPNLDDYYDYEKYGADHIARQEGEFNEFGYVSYQGEISIKELIMENPCPLEDDRRTENKMEMEL